MAVSMSITKLTNAGDGKVKLSIGGREMTLDVKEGLNAIQLADKAVDRLRDYVVICQRDGYNGSMAFADANDGDMERGARTPVFARAYIKRWLRGQFYRRLRRLLSSPNSGEPIRHAWREGIALVRYMATDPVELRDSAEELAEDMRAVFRKKGAANDYAEALANISLISEAARADFRQHPERATRQVGEILREMGAVSSALRATGRVDPPLTSQAMTEALLIGSGSSSAPASDANGLYRPETEAALQMLSESVGVPVEELRARVHRAQTHPQERWPSNLVGRDGRVPIHGNTYPVREQLKAMGGRWDGQAKVWRVPQEYAEQARAIVLAQVPAAPSPEPVRPAGSRRILLED